MRHELRPYQLEAVGAVFDGWGRRELQRVAVVLPTGDGKTSVFVAVVERWLAANPGRRALVVAHRKELIDQAADRVRSQTSHAVGVIMAERNQTLPPILVGSVQTLASRQRRRQLRNVGLIVVDECHRAVAASYLGLLEAWPDALALGVTATMSRSDELALGDVWQDVVYRRTIAQSLRGEGNHGVPTLVRPVGIRVQVDDLDLRRVRTSQGDYQGGDLGRALMDSLAPKKIAEAIREQCPERQGIVFAPSVDSARVIMDALTAEGFAAGLVHGGTPAGERSALLDAFRAGSVRWLCNCMVFTEGTDLPMASVAVIARPTKHSGLYIQMVGRVLRLWPGKIDALVLDVAGAASRHSLDARIELFGAEAAEALEREEIDPADVEPVDPDGVLEIETGLELDFDRDGVEYGPDGKLIFTVVDLFAASRIAWSRTPRGIWYYPGHERFIALVPGDPARGGGIDIVTVQRWGGGSEYVALNRAGLGEAMRIGECVLEPADRRVAKRSRSWQAGVPTTKTLGYAARLGLDVAPGAGAGEVSDMICAVEATWRLDERLLPSLPWITYA